MRILLFLAAFYFSACTEPTSTNVVPAILTKDLQQNPKATILKERFAPPAGFERIATPENSFAQYLQQLPLKPADTKVHLFNGQLKANQQAQAAVIDMDVGTRDLQQCADAIMRLRAEYLYGEKLTDQITFNFTNGFPASFSTWSAGKGIQVKGNQVNWVDRTAHDGSYKSFRKYLNMVFSYAGTLSLSKELPARSIADAQIGDLFIQGGSPGHAVIIVDLAIEKSTGKKAIMLAQSYMPAQDIHILINPIATDKSPWYFIDTINPKLETPEWTFNKDDLKHF